MKLRLVVIILLLSLLLFFGFKKVSANKNKGQSTNIEQLNILRYIPENNKLLFISNLESFHIVNNNEKDKNSINQDDFVLIKDSILDYLGIDLGNNKLEKIFDNELIISFFENNKKHKDDILIVFKIKPEKTLDDILNLPNKIDKIDEIISIIRENKINFLNYIYRTEDNYIIASSDKKLIKNTINSSNDFKEKKFQYDGELFGLKNQKNILFTKKFGRSIFFNKEIFTDRWVNKKKNDVKESAPAKGLCFVNAVYEENIFWPNEKPSWTAAALIIAADSVLNFTDASDLFLKDQSAFY